MLGTTYKTKSKYQFESHTPKNLTIFNKYNSSKIQDSPNFHIDSSKKNSSLHKNPNKQEIRKSDTMKILPIKDLRDTNKISDLCNETNEPIFITKNGYGDMVVMSIKTYEEKLERIEMYEAIIEGLQNVNDGKIKNGPSATSELKKKYDL